MTRTHDHWAGWDASAVARADVPTDGRHVEDAGSLTARRSARVASIRASLTPEPTWMDASSSGVAISESETTSESVRETAAAAHESALASLSGAARTCALMSDADRLTHASRTALAWVALWRPAGMTAPVILDIAQEAAADAISDWTIAALEACGADGLSALADLPDDDLPKPVGWHAVLHARRMLSHLRPASLDASTDATEAAEAIPDAPIVLGPVQQVVTALADDWAVRTVAAVTTRGTARGTTRKAPQGRKRVDPVARDTLVSRLLSSRMTEAERAAAWSRETGTKPGAWRVTLSRLRKAGSLSTAKPIRHGERTIARVLSRPAPYADDPILLISETTLPVATVTRI